jgi:hypothetical protein
VIEKSPAATEITAGSGLPPLSWLGITAASVATSTAPRMSDTEPCHQARKPTRQVVRSVVYAVD